MTSLPAKWFGFRDRSVLREGGFADIVVFDPDRIADTGDFVDPARPALGIEMVIVNGMVAWQGGCSTGARSGRVLRRE
jgi:N-acyl-D-amino-acid deacylase